MQSNITKLIGQESAQKPQELSFSEESSEINTFKEFSQQIKTQCSTSNAQTSSENITHFQESTSSKNLLYQKPSNRQNFSEDKIHSFNPSTSNIQIQTQQKVQNQKQNQKSLQQTQHQKSSDNQNLSTQRIQQKQQLKNIQKLQLQNELQNKSQNKSQLLERPSEQLSTQKDSEKPLENFKSQENQQKLECHQNIGIQDQKSKKELNIRIQKQKQSKQLSKQEILKEIEQIEKELQLTDSISQTSGQIDYDDKETTLKQKIIQIQESLKQLEQSQDEDNQFFIETYKQQLKKAERLSQCYSLLKGTQSGENRQFNELLEYFKIQKQSKNLMMTNIEKKSKTVNNKLSMLKKLKQLKQDQKQQKTRFQNQIGKLKRLRQILQTLQQEQILKQSKQVEPYLTFIFQSKEIGKVKIQFQKTIHQLLNQLDKIDQDLHIKFYLKNISENKKIQIDSKVPILQLIQKPYQKYYTCQIQQCIQIKFDNEQIKLFKKGIDLTDILKKQKIRGKNYFFFSDYQEYDSQIAQIDLQLRECQICDLRYFGKIYKSMLIPLKIDIQKAIQYIEFKKMDIQKLQTAQISKVKIQGVQHCISPKKSLSQFLKSLPKQEKIQQIVIQYKIHLKIDLILAEPREIDLIVSSKQKISKLKQDLQKQCNIDKKLQKWTLGGQQIMNETCFQQLKIFHSRLRLEVTQIKNLEYYGFQTEQQIDTDIYTNFYIEDDQMFKTKIEHSDFPSKSFEFKFRINALSKIFSCIKKHCKIKTGLDSIKSIVAVSNKRCDLWMPSSSQQQTLFNQNYVLLHVLNCAKKDLAIQLCKTYKNHSPIPLKTVKMNGGVNDMRQIHYWICTKSLNIVSIDLFGSVRGKSTFLNEMFKTDFQTKAKHPISQKSVFIKYNIYRNPNYLVDLIDVSSHSMNQKEKINLCRHANILIIHLHEHQQQEAKKWIQKYCKDTPIIYVYRQSNWMKNQEKFKKEMQQNKFSKIEKKFHIINIQKQSFIAHHQYKFRQISNCINQFVIEIQSELQNQKKWLLNKYFENNNKILTSYTLKLRNLQKQFSNIVDLKLLYGEYKNISSIKNSKVILDLIDIQNPQNISNFMSKMKQFSRIQRTKNLFMFSSNLQKIKNILQKKNDHKIQDRKQQLSKYIQNLQDISNSQKTERFIKGLQKFNQQKLNLTYQILQQIYTKYLKKQLDQQIQKKEFSIQNFWRILNYIYSASEELKEDLQFKKVQQLVSSQALKIFSSQFQKGKTIQLINGDSLQMPIKIFKNHYKKLADKHIMVIAVVGGQSSGKSNLLNFLFGCDFLSSQGRCTSGVYMTYYQIQGGNIPGCDGILVLDTQGLFSNIVRQKQEAKNFDNKLLLFLLKSVDILIVNCQGQIKKDIQDILQLSFDSQLMKYQPGTKYPHFNIVLNMKPDSMNSQNITEIQVLRQNIVENNPQMEKYISSQQSNQLPFAFTSKSDEGMETFLSSIQRNQKIATKKFYQATRMLSLNLLNIIKKRGRSFQPRTLESIYDQMYSTWSTLLRFPILTQHVNRRLKQFQDSVQKFICKQIQLLNQKAKIFSMQIPTKIIEIDPWMQKRIEQIQGSNKLTLDDFQNKFINKGIETNDLAARYKDKLNDKLKSFQTNFKLLVTENKYKLSLSESQNRGLQNLNKKARQLRSSTLKEQQKQKQFYKSWSKYTEGIQQKIDRRSNSQQIFHNVQLFYNNHMKNNQLARLNQSGYQQSSYQTFQEYYEKIKYQFTEKIQTNNNIEAKQIQPVISISSQETTDLKYNYFDMRIFFEPVPTKFYYYINFKSLNTVINLEEINKKVKLEIKQSQIIKNFIQYLKQDMSFFGTKFNKEQITKKLIDVFDYPYQCNSKIYIEKNYFNVNHKVFENNFQIFKTLENQSNLNSNRDDNHSNKNHVSKKNNNNNHNPKNKYLQKQKQKQGQFRKNEILNWNSFFSSQKFQLFQVYQVKNVFQEAKRWWHTFYNGNKAEDVAKLLIQKSIKNYVENNLNLYRQYLENIKNKFIQQSFNDLNKIGIYPKRYFQQSYYGNIQLIQCQFQPIEVEKYSEISEIINRMSSLVLKKNLISLISEQKIQGTYYTSKCIAYSLQKKIQIKQDFKIHKQLSRYKDRQYDWLHKNIKQKQFINFVKKYINFQRILDEIKKKIDEMKGELKIQDFVQVIAIVIKKQLQDFNLDLRQISHGVSFQFIYLVHDFTKKLIWKKLQIERIKKIKQQQQKLKQDEQEQKKIFFGNLQLQSEPRSLASAATFVDLYKKFVEPKIQAEKQKFLQEKQKEFQQTYTRKTIQDYVDTEMMNCNDPDVLIQYLRYPSEVIKSYYNNFLQRKIEQIQHEFYCESKNCVTQLYKIFKQMLVNYNQDPFKWQVDVLFQQKCLQQKDKDQLAVILKKILIEVIMSGQNITSNHQNNKFELREQVIIEAQKPISHHLNYTFLKNQLEFEIMNLAYFVRFTQKGLEGLKKDVQRISNFSDEQLDSLKQKSKIVLCDKVCPCCDRLCDIDMRTDPHHTIHRIDSGHQMRAVKGMIVQKITDKGKQQFASVIRCQDVQPKDTFEFYGQEYQWQYFKQLKSSEWNFDSKQVNKVIFQKIWNTCGTKLCEQFTKSGKPMKFIQYSQGNIRYIQQTQQNTEYIFAIDGSGSMQGSPWDQQLKSLKTILNQISTDQSNTASILVFTCQCIPFCINQKPGPINVKQIQFPSGGTTPDPTFIEVARIARQINLRQQKNIYFFYISDGDADHPSEGIRQILQCKKQLAAKKLKFQYTSILIGDKNSSGGRCMQRINQQMGGRSEYVANAANLGQKMKQVLRK